MHFADLLCDAHFSNFNSSIQEKPKKKEEPMTLEEAIDDSENLTDFLMDFDEED